MLLVARQLTVEYGRSYEEKSLRRMMQFAQICRIEGWNVKTLKETDKLTPDAENHQILASENHQFFCKLK